jgi:hypothetical protein
MGCGQGKGSTLSYGGVSLFVLVRECSIHARAWFLNVRLHGICRQRGHEILTLARVLFSFLSHQHAYTRTHANFTQVRLLSGSLIPVWDHIHEVVQRASLRGGSGVTSSQADMKVG